MYLADTNIFLEILLRQEKSEVCKHFLIENYDKVAISDFSLHSIGVILFRYKKHEVFIDFARDVVSNIKVVGLPTQAYQFSLRDIESANLDFDDYYQYSVARYFDLEIVTMDADFKRIDDVTVRFL